MTKEKRRGFHVAINTQNKQEGKVLGLRLGLGCGNYDGCEDGQMEVVHTERGDMRQNEHYDASARQLLGGNLTLFTQLALLLA